MTAQGQHSSRSLFQVEQWVLENIHTFFSDLQITLQDLRNPTPEMVSKIYGAFLEELSVNTANLRLIQNNQMQLITHVDMYNVSVPLINHHRCLSFFLESIGVKTMFNMSDLVAPNSKRTLHFFEALLRFLVYSDDRIGSIQPEMDKINKMGVRRTELLEKIEILRSEINKRASSRSTRRDKYENVCTYLVVKVLNALFTLRIPTQCDGSFLNRKVVKTTDLEQKKFDALLKEKEAHMSTQNSFKKLLEEDTLKENHLIQTLKQMVDDVNALKEMLVNSPEKLKRSLDKPTEKRNELKESERNLKDQLEAKKQLSQTISREQVKQDERLERVRELLTIRHDIAEEEKIKSDLRKQCAQIVESYNESKMQIFKREERLKILVENLENLNGLKKTQEKEDREQLEKAKRELNDLIEQRKENVDRLIQIQKEVNQVLKDIEQLEGLFTTYKESQGAVRAQHQLMKENMIKKYTGIISKLQSINKNIMNNK